MPLVDVNMVPPGPVSAVDRNLAVSATEVAVSVVTVKFKHRVELWVRCPVFLPLRQNVGPGRDVNPRCR